MNIDAHTHAFHPKIAGKVLKQLNGHYNITPKGTGIIDDLLERASKSGIDKVVVHTAATSPDQVTAANDWAIHLNSHYDRVIAFGSMHPDYPDPESEFRRLEENNIKGLKFHPDFQGFFMDDPKFKSVMELIEDRFVLMFHVGDKNPPEKNPSCPKKLLALRLDFPKPVIIAAHLGGYLHWEWSLEYLAGRDIFFDTSSSMPYIRRDTLKALLNRHSKDRILFGSDYPLFDPGEEMKLLKETAGLNDTQMEEILENTTPIFQDILGGPLQNQNTHHKSAI